MWSLPSVVKKASFRASLPHGAALWGANEIICRRAPSQACKTHSVQNQSQVPTVKQHLGKVITSWQEPLGNPRKEAGVYLLGTWVCRRGEAKGLRKMSSQIHFLTNLILFWKQVLSRFKGLSTAAPGWRLWPFCAPIETAIMDHFWTPLLWPHAPPCNSCHHTPDFWRSALRPSMPLGHELALCDTRGH